MRRLLAYGGPSGLQLLVEVVGFTFFIFIVGQLGQDALAATNLAFNINSLAWVPMMGLGIAVSTIVGQQLGRNRDAMAARATWVSFSLALFYMGTIALAYVVVPQWFLLGHAAGMSADRFAALRDITVVLLRFVAAYSLFDAMNLIFANAIKGAGDTRFILATSAIMAPLPTAISWWGIRHWHWGLCGCWTAVTVWICTLGVVYLLRFLQGRWRTMRVIEPAALVLERDALPGQVVDQGQP
jgi:MATE family multidrug resistance protein